MSSGVHAPVVDEKAITKKILVVDDQQMEREGLCALLLEHPGLEIVGKTGDHRKAVRLARRLKPDLLIIDSALPEMGSVEVTQQILALGLSCNVLALLRRVDRRLVLQMLKAGASGFVLKETASNEIVDAIRCVVADRFYLSANVTKAVVQEYLAMAKTITANAVPN